MRTKLLKISALLPLALATTQNTSAEPVIHQLPEAGATLLLLGLGSMALFGFRAFFGSKKN